MKKYRRILPSLDALVFFEAAARHISFTLAAEELYVTQAAVSKRIRELESKLGIELFHRDGRILTLTTAGQRLLQRCAMALEYLEEACRQAHGEEVETIRLAANSAISLLWLPPRLREFGLGENAANVNLFTSDIAGDTLSHEQDLVVTYGYGDAPGWDSQPLFAEELVPVAAPDYLESTGIDNTRELTDESELPARLTLLEYARLAPDWINWQVWIEKTGNSGLKQCSSRLCRNYAQAIGAAINGQGLALGSLGLIDAELDTGRLCRVGRQALSSGRSYYLARPKKKILSPAASIFCEKLFESLPE